jgi:hypothetical protein
LSEKQLILAFVSNLMISARIESVVEQLGFAYRDITSLEDELVEKPKGAESSLLDRITPQVPALLIFDLGDQAIPWESWIQQLKASSASKEIPVICFGPHVDGNAFKLAREAGADTVLARSKFMSDLPNLITQILT